MKQKPAEPDDDSRSTEKTECINAVVKVRPDLPAADDDNDLEPELRAEQLQQDWVPAHTANMTKLANYVQ